uniref:ABC transporter B family member 1-like isoform X1 n=2 Tax=Petromyzon marinus TaxID=7757 RepID=A0AAJ7WVU9_PETMA|nr:ABC transporter B family member 1-like isoform X1 [Petromyzon marinus]
MAQQKIIYTLPTVRFISVTNLCYFIDGLTAVLLWILGGPDHYLENDILHWSFATSTFDMAGLSALKTCLLIGLFMALEHAALKQLDQPDDLTLARRRKTLQVVCGFLALMWLSYTVAKGAVVLKSGSYKHMPLTFHIMLISSFAFSLFEFVLNILCHRFLNKLELLRIIHKVEDTQEEEDKRKKNVGICRVLSLAKEETGIVVLGMIALLGSSGTQMVSPVFFGKVIDAARNSMNELNEAIFILFGIYVGGALCSFVRSYLFTFAGQRMVARLRTRLFEAVMAQEVAFFDENRTGEITNRLSNDTQVIQNAVTVNISMLVRYAVQILGSLVVMFVLSPALCGVLIASVPFVAIGAVQYGNFVKRLRKNFQDELASAGSTAEEAVSSVRTVRAFCGEGRMSAQYDSDVQRSFNIGRKIALAEGAFSGLVGTVAQGAVVLVLWYGGKLVYENLHGQTGISVGTLTAFMLYTLNVAMGFALLASLYGDFMQAVGASQRVFELLDRQPRIPNTGGRAPPSVRMDGRVSFNDIHFCYPSRPDTPVLQGVSFSVEPGTVVALVGPSGGGKSTIVALLQRFYDPSAGSIIFGGTDLRELDPQWFRQTMAVVSQEPVLFATTIHKNISYGREATFEEVVEAAKQANAHDFILSFEEGYETLVGERGVRLSGGQKQRIAIARALIMNPVLLLLDEATSALDAESEHLVQEAIDRAMQDRTVLVIAHRLSTVRSASQVVVVDKGQIVERGTHDALLAHQGGVYRRLVLRQLSAGHTSAPCAGDGDAGSDGENGDKDEGNGAEVKVKEPSPHDAERTDPGQSQEAVGDDEADDDLIDLQSNG